MFFVLTGSMRETVPRILSSKHGKHNLTNCLVWKKHLFLRTKKFLVTCLRLLILRCTHWFLSKYLQQLDHLMTSINLCHIKLLWQELMFVTQEERVVSSLSTSVFSETKTRAKFLKQWELTSKKDVTVGHTSQSYYFSMWYNKRNLEECPRKITFRDVAWTFFSSVCRR